MTDGRRTDRVLEAPIDVIDWSGALARLLRWGHARESRIVCICNVHSVVTASRDGGFARVLAAADLATPDGAPVAWMLRRLGHAGQQRIDGPGLMLRLCEAAAAAGLPVALYGSTSATLALLQQRLRARWPALAIVAAIAPPFRTLDTAEDAADVAQLNAAGPAFVFVSLGCPKQERWMAEHRGRVAAVMLGVGAAFDFHAGTVARAPAWMRERGLEWLHRLAGEPRRLWRRYLVTNTLFVLGAARQLAARGRQAPTRW